MFPHGCSSAGSASIVVTVVFAIVIARHIVSEPLDCVVADTLCDEHRPHCRWQLRHDIAQRIAEEECLTPHDANTRHQKTHARNHSINITTGLLRQRSGRRNTMPMSSTSRRAFDEKTHHSVKPNAKALVGWWCGRGPGRRRVLANGSSIDSAAAGVCRRPRKRCAVHLAHAVS